MSFHNMERKELQALCKEHKIPANLSNLEMANRLKEHFKEKEKSPKNGQKSGQDFKENKEKEKSPQKGKINGQDFKGMKRKHLQALCRKNNIPANLTNLEMAERLTDFLSENEKSPVHEPINVLEKTESTDMGFDFHNMKYKELQVLCKTHNIPANSSKLEMAKRLTELLRENEKSPVHEPINVLDKTESTDMGFDFHNMKYKELQVLCKTHNIPANSSKLEMAKRLTELLKEKEKPSVQVQFNEHDENASETESMDMSMNRKVKKVRFSPDHELFEYTRSPKLKQNRRNSVSIRPSNLSVETVDNGLMNIENVDGQCRVTRSRGLNLVEEIVTKTKRVRQAVERAPEKNEAKKVQMVIEPQVVVKRSKRNSNPVVDSRIFNDETRNCKNDGVKGSRKLSKLSEISEGVLQIEEHVEIGVRRGDRRKSVITVPVEGKKSELKAEMGNARNSVLGLIIAGGVSKNEKVPQPLTRRSRRKTIITEPVASEEILDTDVAVDNCETEKCLSTRRSRKTVSVCKSLENKDELGGDTIIQQKNEPRKRKRGPTSEGDARSSSKLSTEEGKNERSVSVVEPQLSKSAQAESGSDTGTRNKTMTSDVRLDEFVRKTLREEQVVSIAESAAINFSIGNLLVNLEENATPRIAELETDLADSEKSISSSNIKCAGRVDSFEFDVQDVVDKDITNMNNNQSEPVSGYESFAEPISAPESISLVDHVGEVEEVLVQENLDSVEHVGEVEEVWVQGNLDSVETGETNVISLEITDHHNNVEASNEISEDNKEDIGEVGARESFDDPEVTESEADSGTHPDLDLADDHLGEDEEILVQNVDHVEAPNNIFDKEDGASQVEEVLVQENLDSVEHVGEVEEVWVQGNLDSVETGETNVISLEITDHHNNVEASNEISEDNKEDIGEVGARESFDDPEVTESEADSGTHPDLDLADDHLGEDEEILVQNVDHVEAPNNIFDKEDGASQVEEVLVQENLDSVEHVGEVEEVWVQGNLDSVETGETNVISLEITDHHNNVEASNEISEDNKEDIGEVGARESFDDPEVTESEADSGTHPDLDLADDHLGEDEEILVQNVDHVEAPNNIFDKEDGASQAVGTPDSCDRCIYHTDSKSASQLKDTASGNLRIVEGEGDDAETEKEKCLNEHKIASDEDDEFAVADLFAGERSVMKASQNGGIVSGECSAMKSDEQRVDVEYLTESQKTISSIATNICTMRDLEAEHSCREESCIDKSIKVAKTDAGGSLDRHENQEFVMSQIPDVERRKEIVKKGSGLLSGEDSANRFDENAIDFEFKSCCEDDQRSEGDEAENNDNYKNRIVEDREFGDKHKGFNEQAVFVDFPVVSTMSDEFEIGVGSSRIKEISPSKQHSFSKSPGSNPIISEACEIVQNESGDANIPDKEIAIAQAEEIDNECIPKQAEQLKSPFATTTAITNTLGANESETTRRPMLMSQTWGQEITSPFAQGFNVNEDGAKTLCESESHHSEDTVYHRQSLNLHAKPSQSLTEIEATVNDVTPTGLNGSVNKFDANSGNILTNKKENEMEEEKGSESAKSTCGGASLPININSLSEVEKTSRHGKELDRVDLSITECVGTTKENAVAQIKFDETEFEKRSSSDTGDEINYEEVNAAESDTGDEINYEEVNATESVELPNTSGLVLSEASDEHLTENTCDDVEEEIIPLGESCLCVEATENRVSELTEKIAISSFGSPRNFDNVEHMDADFLENLGSEKIVSHKSERKLAQSSGAELEFSDADIQNPYVLENNYHLTATKEGTNLSEILIDTPKGSMYTEGENVVSCNDEEAETGTPPSLLTKVSSAGDAIFLTNQEVSDYGPGVDREDYQLRLLYATPIEIDSPPNENELKNSVVDEKLQDAENEHEHSLHPSSDTAEKINCEESDGFECVELMKTSGLVLSEASEEPVTENTCDEGCLEKSDSIIEVNEEEIISPGESCLFEKAVERGCGLTEENTLSSSGSLKNLGEVEFFLDRLMDTDLVEENLRCDNRVCSKSEIKMSPSNGAEFEISDADILGTHEGHMDAKGANIEKDMTGTSSNLLPKVSDYDDEDVTERKSEEGDGKSKKMDGVDDNSSPSVANIEFQSTYNYMLPAAGQLVPVRGAEDGDSEKSYTGTPHHDSGGDLEKNSEGTEENLAAIDTGNGEESDMGTPVLNLEGDNEENDKEIGEITTVAEVQVPISELHLEEKIDVPTAAFGCNEFLKECDVANTIKEYIDYELNCIGEIPACEDGKEKLEESIGGFTDDKLVETKEEEQMIEEVLLKDSGNSGSAGNDVLVVAKEEIESSSRQVCSSVKENARTILIHGTPSKVGTMVDMKENGSAFKSSNVGDFTAARPAGRKALQDVKWK